MSRPSGPICICITASRENASLTRRVSCLQAGPEANRASGEEGLYGACFHAVDLDGECALCARKRDTCLRPTPVAPSDTDAGTDAYAAAAARLRSGLTVDFRQRRPGDVRHRDR